MEKKLYRSKKNRTLLGVYGGLAEYFNMDYTVMKVIGIVLALCGVGILAYIIAALVIPEAPDAE